MPDWDAVIIGGGLAGLTAGLYLSRGNWRTLLIEKGSVSGYIMNVETVENYPGFSEGVVGSVLGMEMKEQVIVNGLMETEIPGILAAGDVRSGSPRQVAAAVGDGATAGMAAQRFLQKLK